MAIEKVGVYRKWLEAVPRRSGRPIPRSQWPRKRRHRWVVRWFGSNGKRYGKVFETRKEADKYALELQNRVDSGKPDRPKKITLGEFMREHEQVMQGQVAHATLQDQMRALRFFAEYAGSSRVLRKIHPRHAEAFIADRLASGLSVGTVNKDIRTLRRIFNLAIEPRGYVGEGHNPFGKLKQRRKAKKPIRYVQIVEYRKLLDAAKNTWWKALLSLGYGSGLRKNEILHLTWADIDFENQLIRVTPKGQTKETIDWEPKDHEKRVVPMSTETVQLLVRMQVDAEEGHPYVFIWPTRLERIRERVRIGKWNSRSEVVNNLRTNFHSMRRRANLTEFTLHDLRKSAITNWAQHLPIQIVQQLAGHSDISTTREYYLAVRTEDLVSANAVLNRVLDCSQDD